jgi:hypothetical protein
MHTAKLLLQRHHRQQITDRSIKWWNQTPVQVEQITELHHQEEETNRPNT